MEGGLHWSVFLSSICSGGGLDLHHPVSFGGGGGPAVSASCFANDAPARLSTAVRLQDVSFLSLSDGVDHSPGRNPCVMLTTTMPMDVVTFLEAYSWICLCSPPRAPGETLDRTHRISNVGTIVSFPPWRRCFGCSWSSRSVRQMESMLGRHSECELLRRNVHRCRHSLVDALSALVSIPSLTRRLLGAKGRAVH